MKKRILSLILGTTLVIGSAATAMAEPKVEFKDLSGYDWAKSNIEALVATGAVAGYGDNTYRPGNNITVAEFTKIAVSLVAEPEDIDAMETESIHWAAKYMAYAEEKEMLDEGMYQEDDWNTKITRQNMAVIMENTAQKVLNETTLTDADKLEIIKNKFTDYSTICSNCQERVVQAYARGLIAGYPNGTFGPARNANRAEAAAMLVRMIDRNYRLTVDYSEPADDIEKHIISKIPARADDSAYEEFDKKYPESQMLSGDRPYVEVDSAKALGFSLISAENNKVTFNQPQNTYVHALDKNGKLLATSQTYYYIGYGVFKNCDIDDIAYITCYLDINGEPSAVAAVFDLDE